MNIKLLALACLVVTFLLPSCAYHELEEPAPPDPGACLVTVSFSGEVESIIEQKCALPTCHNGDLGPDKDWTVFTTFQSKKEQVKSRITLSPGAPGRMPAAGSLTPDEIQTIVCWVDQGGLNN